MCNDIERLRSELRAFAQSCAESDGIAEDALKELLELCQLTGQPVQELWRKHVRNTCCLEQMELFNANSCSQLTPAKVA